MTTAQDETRARAIAEYDVIGRPPEADLEGLVQLAATISGVSTAVINIIDDRFQHQVAAVGFSPSVCSREDSMCAVVFKNPGHVVISDAREDERFRTNPFVTGAVASVRFYASSPLITPAGIPIGTLCVFDEEAGDLSQDRSDALALLAHQVVDVLELRRMTGLLSESNERLESFAGQVSHDLRNPLAAVSGFIELAADSVELVNAPRAARALAHAESAATRMEAMINDLLDFARASGSTIRHESVDLALLMRGVLEDLDSAVRESGARIIVDASIEVAGDPTLLRVLLQNLVANAIKFGGSRGIESQIEVRAHSTDLGWRITVDDNGPGVPAVQRDRIFELMHRGDTYETPGLGIGLSTCQRIAEAHDGRIGVDESPLGGASFWVELPRR